MMDYWEFNQENLLSEIINSQKQGGIGNFKEQLILTDSITKNEVKINYIKKLAQTSEITKVVLLKGITQCKQTTLDNYSFNSSLFWNLIILIGKFYVFLYFMSKKQLLTELDPSNMNKYLKHLIFSQTLNLRRSEIQKFIIFYQELKSVQFPSAQLVKKVLNKSNQPINQTSVSFQKIVIFLHTIIDLDKIAQIFIEQKMCMINIFHFEMIQLAILNYQVMILQRELLRKCKNINFSLFLLKFQFPLIYTGWQKIFFCLQSLLRFASAIHDNYFIISKMINFNTIVIFSKYQFLYYFISFLKNHESNKDFLSNQNFFELINIFNKD